MYSSKNNKS